MPRRDDGFTLIELMIVVAIIGTLAAIAIPNFMAMAGRAKEGATKSNMHTFQLAAEDYGVQFDSQYAPAAAQVAAVMPSGGANFKNPFTSTVGSGAAWEDRASIAAAPTAFSGIVSYADSANNAYNIKAHGKTAPLTLVLIAGQ